MLMFLMVTGCSTPEISGKVTGAVSSGVTITLSGGKSASTTTDSSGNYSFAGLGNGSYTVTPSLAGYTFNPTSTTVYIVNNNNQLANFTATAEASSSVSKFAYTANSGSNNISVYTINQTTGALTYVTSAATGSYPVSVTIDASGQFAYAANYGDNTISVYTINQTTGALTLVTTGSAGAGPQCVTTTTGAI